MKLSRTCLKTWVIFMGRGGIVVPHAQQSWIRRLLGEEFPVSRGFTQTLNPSTELSKLLFCISWKLLHIWRSLYSRSLLSEHGEKTVTSLSFYFSSQNGVAFWSSQPVLNSSSEINILHKEGFHLWRKSRQRTNILLSLMSPVLGRTGLIAAGTWAELLRGQADLSFCNSKL